MDLKKILLMFWQEEKGGVSLKPLLKIGSIFVIFGFGMVLYASTVSAGWWTIICQLVISFLRTLLLYRTDIHEFVLTGEGGATATHLGWRTVFS